MSLIIGDCRDTMRRWIAAGVKVQCCITSPPYWGLRDYGVAGQLGLEPTPQEYVANMVEVFRLVRELLTDDGTLWLNLGDSYASGGRGGGVNGERGEKQRSNAGALLGPKKAPAGLKDKDLVGIPWRVAFALQADGWYLRQDIIWAKPNPMPESVTDRCTKSHEYLFLMAKSQRYYYDAAAIAERAIYAGSIVTLGEKSLSKGQAKGANRPASGNGKASAVTVADMRNRRSVWTIQTKAHSETHFAVFPRALVEPCIMAGSRAGDTVLDPFLGSGTVGRVAEDLGRKWLGCELNPDYGKITARRTAQIGIPLGVEVNERRD